MAFNLSMEDAMEHKGYLTFSWFDYSLFVLMFGLSTVIGLYFGCFGSKQSSASEYLLGGKSMGVFPVAMSLIASHLSGITLLGIPSDVYMYGTQYWMCAVCIIIVGLCMIYIYLPVFYKLQLNSSYEYLNLRFDDRTRKMAAVLYVINTILYIPIVIYIPALAFNQVSRLNIHVITPIVCLLCIFYTTIGGLKAVVWSDTLQFSVTLGAMFGVLGMGIVSAGGFGKIWEKAEQGERLEFFNMNLDPTIRTSFWHVVIGVTVQWASALGINPASVQRFLSVPSMKDAKLVIAIFVAGTMITKSVSIYSGLIIYAKYSDCDPLKSNEISRTDQLLPYYVLDVAKSIPGLAGVFIAGVFSTALSAMSTNLNTLSGTIYEDFIAPARKRPISEKGVSNIMKLIVVIVGLICVGLVFVVEKLGGVFQICMSLSGVTSGPLLGMFTLGMLLPFANSKGAFYGSATGLVVITWICINAQLHILSKNIIYEPKPLTTDGCNDTIFVDELFSNHTEEPAWIYRISFYYYTLIGFIITMLIGSIVSWFTKEAKVSVDRDLLSPVVYWYLDRTDNEKKYTYVENNLNYPITEKCVDDNVDVLNLDKYIEHQT